MKFIFIFLMIISSICFGDTVIMNALQKKDFKKLTDDPTLTLWKLFSTCGASFSQKELTNISRYNAYDEKKAISVVDLEKMIGQINKLKKKCNTVATSGGFYICKNDNGYTYYNSEFNELTDKNCDHVIQNGSEIFCLKKNAPEKATNKKSKNSGGKFEVITSHKINQNGVATCTSTDVFKQLSKPPAGEMIEMIDTSPDGVK